MQNDTPQKRNRNLWWMRYALSLALAGMMVLPNIAQAKGKKSGKNFIDGPNGKIEVFAEKNAGQKTTTEKDSAQKKKKWPTFEEMRRAPACKPLSEVKESLKSNIPAYEAWLMGRGYSPTEGKFGRSYNDFTSYLEDRKNFDAWIAQAYGNKGSPLSSMYVFLPDAEHYVQTGEWRADPKEVDRYVARFVVGRYAKKAQDALRAFMAAPDSRDIAKNRSISAWQKVCRTVAKDPHTGEVDEEMMDNLVGAFPVGCAMRDLAQRGYQGNLLDLFKTACDYVCQNPVYADGVRRNLYILLDNAQRSGEWGDDIVVAADAYMMLGRIGFNTKKLLSVIGRAQKDRLKYLQVHPDEITAAEIKQRDLVRQATQKRQQKLTGAKNPAVSGQPPKPTYNDKPAKNLFSKPVMEVAVEKAQAESNNPEFEEDDLKEFNFENMFDDMFKTEKSDDKK